MESAAFFKYVQSNIQRERLQRFFCRHSLIALAPVVAAAVIFPALFPLARSFLIQEALAAATQAESHEAKGVPKGLKGQKKWGQEWNLDVQKLQAKGCCLQHEIPHKRQRTLMRFNNQ